MRFRLVPEHGRRDIVLQRKVSSSVPPAQGLDGHLQIALKPDRVRNMPAIEPKSLLRIVMAIATDHLRQAGIGGGKFGIMRLGDPGGIFGVGIEIIGPAEIIFCPRPADRRPIPVAIHIELYLSLAPPAIIMYAPRQIGADVLPFTVNAIQ